MEDVYWLRSCNERPGPQKFPFSQLLGEQHTQAKSKQMPNNNICTRRLSVRIRSIPASFSSADGKCICPKLVSYYVDDVDDDVDDDDDETTTTTTTTVYCDFQNMFFLVAGFVWRMFDMRYRKITEFRC